MPSSAQFTDGLTARGESTWGVGKFRGFSVRGKPMNPPKFDGNTLIFRQARLVAFEWPQFSWPERGSHHWSSLEVRHIRHWSVFLLLSNGLQAADFLHTQQGPDVPKGSQRPSPGTELSPWKVCVYTSVVCLAVSLVYSKFVLGPLGFIDTILLVPLKYCCDRPRVQMSYNTLKSSKVFVSRANHMSTCTKSTQSTFLSVSVLESILVVV